MAKIFKNRLDLATWGIPAIVLSVVGGLIGSAYDGVFFTMGGTFILWSAGLWGWGFLPVREKSYAVIERFDCYHSIKYPGWRWVNPFCDRIKERGSLKGRRVPLYKDDKDKKAQKIDFQDSSACVLVWGWYLVGNPIEVAAKNWDAVTSDILLWTYYLDNPELRVATCFDGEFRFRIQGLTTDDAQKEPGKAICKVAADAAAPLLADIGAYPLPKEALIIEDIALPPETERLRELILEAKKKLEADTLEFQSTGRAIAALIEGSKNAAGDPTVSNSEAQGLVQQTQILKTLERTGSNITMIAPGMTGVMQQLQPASIKAGE
ncbi:MAG: hypothetical protein V4480_04025 [Patescibacteria group bacterium]